jgi:hypothetical protein
MRLANGGTLAGSLGFGGGALVGGCDASTSDGDGADELGNDGVA